MFPHDDHLAESLRLQLHLDQQVGDRQAGGEEDDAVFIADVGDQLGRCIGWNIDQAEVSIGIGIGAQGGSTHPYIGKWQRLSRQFVLYNARQVDHELPRRACIGFCLFGLLWFGGEFLIFAGNMDDLVGSLLPF